MDDRYVLLACVPRSGSTLICELLNELPNIVAIDDPVEDDFDVYTLRGEDFLQLIGKKLARFRKMIKEEKRVNSMQAGNQIAQHYTDNKDAQGFRERVVTYGFLRIDKALADDFVLVAKAFFPFLLNLDGLQTHYPMYGVVRNPLAVLASMNTLKTWEKGYFDDIRIILPDLIEELQAVEDKVARIIKVISAYFEPLIPLLETGRIIAYEDVIRSQGKVLERIVPQARHLSRPLVSKNANPVYEAATMQRLGQQLLESEGAFWHFYSKDDVNNLLNNMK